LQRTIVADESVRRLWQKAFAAGEPTCEALGSCHLLLHGIWAFKTSAEGERTDLVLHEPLNIATSELQRASVGLVLTEWKLVRRVAELPDKLEQAYRQAKRYRQGILSGFEVASPRYLVIVSERRLEMPPPRQDEGVMYEYRNVAVRPLSPSKERSGRAPRASGQRKEGPPSSDRQPPSEAPENLDGSTSPSPQPH
jgi:hypothetical protein